MLMVCPNCSSTDIITVQDQRFCISCGQVLPGIAPEPEPTPTPAPVTTQAAPPADAAGDIAVPKRRKPGRPKAGRMDTPLTNPPAPTTSTPTPAAPLAPATAAVTPVAAAAPRITQPSRQRLSDIAPVSQTPAPKARPVFTIASAPIAPPTTPPAQPVTPPPPNPAKNPPATTPKPTLNATAQQDSAPTKSIAYGAVENTALHDRFRPSAFLWAIWPAALLAILAGIITYILIGGRAKQALTITQQAGWSVWGELVLVFMLFYIGRTIGSSAIAYGAARRADHRPLSARHQLSAALNSFHKRLGFDLMLTTFQAATVALIVTLVIVGGTNWPVPELAQVITLFLAYLILGYVLAGLGLTQALGHIALTLGKLSIWQAFTLSWNFFRQHFEMIGFKFLSLCIELILAIPLFAAVFALVVYLPHQFAWLIAVGVVIFTLIGGTLLGAGTAVWWQAAYQALVHRRHPEQAHKLLSGRRPQPAQGSAAILITILIVVIGGLAVAWPWLPLG